MKKKLLSLLLTVAMVASIIGTIPVFATDTAGGPTLDFTTGGDKTGTGYTWVDNTLTLTNFNYTSTDGKGIKVPDGATIVLVGDNTLTTTADAGAVDSYGIEAKGKLTITGDGTLAVTSSDTTGANGTSIGISSTGAVTINGGATVTATGAKALYSTGIYSEAILTINGGANVIANGGEATKESYGIYSYESINISGATVTATGGNTPGTKGKSFGINSANLTITDSAKVTAEGGEATEESYGIISYESINISGATVTATGVEAALSTGIYSWDLIITDSTVTATGVEATGVGYGIYSGGIITITDSKVTVTAGTATVMSCGISGGTIDISDPTNVLDIKSGDAIMVSAAVFGGDIDIGEVSFDIPVGAHVAKVAMPEDLSILSDEEPEEQGPFAIFGGTDANPAKHVKSGDATPETPETPETPTIPEIKPSDNTVFEHDRDFDTLENIYFDGQKLKLTDGGANRKYITGYNDVDTVNVGEVTRGSVIITMYPQFLRTLPLGTYTVALTFTDSATGVPAEEDVIQQFTLVADKTTNFPSYPSYGGGYYGSSTATATTYNVTLNLFDGATETVKTEDGNIVKLPANPIREGYVFLGWYTDKELTKMVAPDTRITANTTIYARWHKTVEMPTVTEPTEVPQTSDSWFKF